MLCVGFVPQDTNAADGIRLYKYVVAGDAGKWEPLSANAQPSFYDANADTGAKTADWHLEIGSGDIDVHCDGNQLAYEFAVRERRITFSVAGDIFALRYPSQVAAQAFCEELRDRCFYNEHKFDIHDEDKARKELGVDGMYLSQVRLARAAHMAHAAARAHDATDQPLTRN